MFLLFFSFYRGCINSSLMVENWFSSVFLFFSGELFKFLSFLVESHHGSSSFLSFLFRERGGRIYSPLMVESNLSSYSFSFKEDEIVSSHFPLVFILLLLFILWQGEGNRSDFLYLYSREYLLFHLFFMEDKLFPLDGREYFFPPSFSFYRRCT